MLIPGKRVLTSEQVAGYEELGFAHSVSILTLRVAKNVLQRYVGSPESLVNIAISGSHGAGALASRVIREIWKSSDVALGPGVAPRCANVVLELIACAAGRVTRVCAAASPTAFRRLPRWRGCLTFSFRSHGSPSACWSWPLCRPGARRCA